MKEDRHDCFTAPHLPEFNCHGFSGSASQTAFVRKHFQLHLS